LRQSQDQRKREIQVLAHLAVHIGMRERLTIDKLQVIDVGFENVDTCGCCGANTLGQQRKREWIKQCLPYGLRYKTVLERSSGRIVGMIEYMPSEYAWRSAHAINYMMIHCVQVVKQYRGQGIGSRLIQDCIDDAKQHKMSGVVALATSHGWCADDRVYLKNGFKVIDNASPSLKLVAKHLRKAEPPDFGDWKERSEKFGTGIYMYCSKQCPFMRREKLLTRKEWLKTKYGLETNIIEINNHEQAQANPCVWGTSGIICNREIINYVSGGRAPLLKKLRQMRLIP